VAGSGVFDDDALNSTWVRFAGIGVNTYKWTIVNGECTEEDQVTYVLSNPVVPEMISPNDDGINDILIIEGLNFDNQVIELTILNGAGALVFSTSNENGNDEWKDWDGKNSKGEELPEGTYYYLLEVDSPIMAPGIDPTKKSGFIILKRK
jgi:gliding motility-associated-like protein